MLVAQPCERHPLSVVVVRQAQPPFLHPAIEGGHHEDGEHGNKHAAEGRDGHGNHDVGSAPGGRENRHEGEQGGGGSEHGRAVTLRCGLQGGRMDRGDVGRSVLAKPLFEDGGHEDAVIGRDTEKCEKSDPDGDREVDGMDLEKVAQVNREAESCSVEEPRLAVKPEEEESAGPGDEDAGENKQAGGDTPELEVKDKEDEDQGERNDEGEFLLGSYLVFVAAGKPVADPVGEVLVRFLEALGEVGGG